MTSEQATFLRCHLGISSGVIACIGLSEGGVLVSKSQRDDLVSSSAKERLSIHLGRSTPLCAGLEIHIEACPKASVVRFSLQSAHPRPTYKAHLLDSEGVVKTSIPIRSGLSDLGQFALSPCRFEIKRSGSTIAAIDLFLEPLALADCTLAALECVQSQRLERALAILRSGFSAYPRSRELWDMIGLTQALLRARHDLGGGDPEFDVFRASVRTDMAPEMFLEETAKQFGRPDIANLAAASSGDVLINTGDVNNLSVVVLEMLTKVLETANANGVAIQCLRQEMKRRNAASRGVEQALSSINASFESLLANRLGSGCWTWLDSRVKGRFVEAEASYRWASFRGDTASPKLSGALFLLCSGLEELLRLHWQDVFAESRQMLRIPDVSRVFEEMKTVRLVGLSGPNIGLGQYASLLDVHDLLFENEAFVKLEIASQMRTKRVQWDTVGKRNVLKPIEWIANLRNSNAHARRMTTCQAVRVARKLILGVDEYKMPWALVAKGLGIPSDQKPPDLWDRYSGIAPLMYQLLR